MNRNKIGLVAGPLTFLLVMLFFEPAGLTDQARAVLACTAWIAIWWITEALPIAVTALLPIILFPLTGGLSLGETTASFGHRYVFLYIGGFVLAIAIQKWNLHKRIALSVIRVVGTDIVKILLGFMIATAFMSMWISNTATTVMMLPIGIAIVAQLQDNPETEENENLIFGKALMLAIAYSATIGGISTLIGTPPNLVLAGVLQETYGIELTFANWFIFGLPISLILLLICWSYLTKIAFKFKQKAFPGGRAEIRNQLEALGPVSFEEKLVLAVFALTAAAWISRAFLLAPFIPAIDDTIIAIATTVVLFILPARERGKKIVTWEEAVKLPWGILLLFGGGMALAAGFQESGLASWLGGQVTLLQGVAIIVLVVVLIAAVNFLTEVTSNLATTAMLLPILAPLALAIDIHPLLLMVAATVAASCAFMLPVATPPNAVVFGSGYLTIPDMVKTGFWLNLISIGLLTLFVYFVLPQLWSFDASTFPEALKTVGK
ncbi:MAG: anion transporter [Acidobacteria bacterium]|nr:MAG: anion transporter [Acidobacteriota bacterium]REJ98374.1 MAG: anion transporter [Acidobacteriota bacterium]REK17118.1 MAG: anion transporter [Acidobacteriota bacterium]REK43028.1 MAG: anion transporter [Acidobacteriota bacterium]